MNWLVCVGLLSGMLRLGAAPLLAQLYGTPPRMPAFDEDQATAVQTMAHCDAGDVMIVHMAMVRDADDADRWSRQAVGGRPNPRPISEELLAQALEVCRQHRHLDVLVALVGEGQAVAMLTIELPARDKARSIRVGEQILVVLRDLGKGGWGRGLLRLH